MSVKCHLRFGDLPLVQQAEFSPGTGWAQEAPCPETAGVWQWLSLGTMLVLGRRGQAWSGLPHGQTQWERHQQGEGLGRAGEGWSCLEQQQSILFLSCDG